MSADSPENSPPIPLVVVGAHLSGMPLNSELQALGATFVRTGRTTPDYRLFELPGGAPAKPGLLRVGPADGVAVDVEIWLLGAAAFGVFVSRVPGPLAIGTVRLSGGDEEKGFLVEEIAVREARDISEHGGWRNYQRSLEPAGG